MKLKDWWKYKGKFLLWDFIEGVKNLIQWFPVIWKDRQWGGYAALDILKFKIEKLSEHFDKVIWVDRVREVETLKTCARLIDKIRTDYYMMEYLEYYITEFHFDKIDGQPHLMSLRTELINNNIEDYIKKYPNTYKKIVKENKNSTKVGISILMGTELHKKAKRILFRLLENNIDEWSD